MLRRAPGKNRLVGVMPIAPRASVVGLHGPLGRKHRFANSEGAYAGGVQLPQRLRPGL